MRNDGPRPWPNWKRPDWKHEKLRYWRPSTNTEQLETVSDTGRRRKRRFKPGAFLPSIEDPAQEITLSVGRNPNSAIASKLSGTLLLRDKDSGLEIEASRVPDTAEFRDLEARADAGMEIHVEPLFQ